MGKIRWYKRDPDAALTGMMVLNLEERGAYNTVLDLIYSQAGALPDDNRFISGWLRVDVRVWKRLRQRLIDLGKLYISEGTIRNSRSDREVDDALSRVASARDAGRASALSKGNKLRGELNADSDLAPTGVGNTAQRALQLPTTTTTPKKEREKKDSCVFSAFWAAFPAGRKVGKRKCIATFDAAVKSGVDPDHITQAAKQYAALMERKQIEQRFIKNSTTWLNQGCWDDELETGRDDNALGNQGIRKVENGTGDSERGGDRGQTLPRDTEDDLPGVLATTEEKDRPVPIGDVQAGGDSLELLALSDGGGCVL